MNRLLPCLLFVIALALATVLEPRFQNIRQENSNILAALTGEGRQFFADYFFTKADAYFHSGNYPSIFEKANIDHAHMTEDHHDGKEVEPADFRAPPGDWIEAIGRRFLFTQHTHLEGGGREREILPWLRLSADLDPHRIETYITTAYWLRKRLGKPIEAEQFLREGLRANPDNSQILLELGHLYAENKNDPQKARNILNRALQKWKLTEAPKQNPDKTTCLEILGALAQLDERENNWNAAISHLEEMKHFSPNPDLVEKRIQEAKSHLEK